MTRVVKLAGLRLPLLAFSVTALAASAFVLCSTVVHAANSPFNPKQQVLWDHLRSAVAKEEQQL
ncbi:MAG TPA: hypothetical protein VGN12_14230, partial [Pirellulales bacterium]